MVFPGGRACPVVGDSCGLPVWYGRGGECGCRGGRGAWFCGGADEFRGPGGRGGRGCRSGGGAPAGDGNWAGRGGEDPPGRGGGAGGGAAGALCGGVLP